MSRQRGQIPLREISEHGLDGVPRGVEFGGKRGSDRRWRIDLKVGMHERSP